MTLSLANNFVLAVLPVLAFGYIIHDALICRLWFSKSTGYSLYFRIITIGLIFLFICQGLIYLLSPLEEEEANVSWLSAHPLAATLFFALFLRICAYLWVQTRGRKTPEWKHGLIKKSLNDKGLDQFIYERIHEKGMIMVTLENRKVYAGWPIEAPGNEDNKWLRVVPQWSGYRNKKSTIKVEINYSEVIGNAPSDKNCILIPVEKIVTLHPFDADTFEQFNPPPTNIN